MKRMVTSVTHVFEQMAEQGTLNKRQSKMQELFKDAEDLLQDTKITNKIQGKEFTMWELFEGSSLISVILDGARTRLVFTDKETGQMLVKRIKELEKAVNDIVAPQKSIFQKGKRWLFENSFGTVDHVRDVVLLD